MFYTIVSIIVLLISIKLFKLNIGSLSLTKLNMVSWIFYFDLIANSFIASILIVNHLDNHYAISRVSDTSRLYGWISTQYVMIALPFGMLLANLFFCKKSIASEFDVYLSKPLVTLCSGKDSYIRLILYLLSAISLFAVAYTFYELKKIPIFEMLKGSKAFILASLRIEASRGFEGNYYFRNIFGITLTPILSYIFFTYYKLTKKQIDLVLFIVLAISSVFIVTYDLSKGPLIHYIIGFLFCKILIKGHLPLKAIIKTCIICLSILIILYFSIMNAVNFLNLFSYNTGIVGRILLGQSAGTYFAFEVYPHKNDFIGFKSLSKYLSLLTGDQLQERSARELMAYFRPDNIRNGTAGVMNSLFISEAWCNWGIIGIILSPIYVGFFVQLMLRFFIHSKKTPILIGMLTHFSHQLPITGGINDFIYNAGIMIVFVTFFCVYFIAIFLKQFRRMGKHEINFPSPTTVGL